MDSLLFHEISHDLRAAVRLVWLDLDRYVESVGLRATQPGMQRPASHAVAGTRRQAARHALRRIVAEQSGVAAASVRIAVDSLGRPRTEDLPVSFNLSRSDGECLIGIVPGTGIEVGVDLEVIRRVPETDALTREYFTRGERREWLRRSAAGRERYLLECWVRKEACAKALGVGFALPPVAIPVGAAPRARCVTVSIRGRPLEIELCTVHVPSGSAAAVAASSSQAARFAGEVLGRNSSAPAG